MQCAGVRGWSVLTVGRVKESMKGFESIMTSDIQVDKLVLPLPPVSGLLEGSPFHLDRVSQGGGSII